MLQKDFVTEHLWTTVSAFGDLKLWKLRIWSHLLKKSLMEIFNVQCLFWRWEGEFDRVNADQDDNVGLFQKQPLKSAFQENFFEVGSMILRQMRSFADISKQLTCHVRPFFCQRVFERLLLVVGLPRISCMNYKKKVQLWLRTFILKEQCCKFWYFAGIFKQHCLHRKG